MAAELTEIRQVFQGRISIRNIDLILTKLGNDLDIGQFHTTVRFHEDISIFKMKTRSFNFALFLWPPNLLRFDRSFKGAFL